MGWKHEYCSKSNDFLFWLLITFHIMEVGDPMYGGAEGGALFIEHRSTFQLQKSLFLGIKCYVGRLSAPLSPQHVHQKSPRHSPLHFRAPPCAPS